MRFGVHATLVAIDVVKLNAPTGSGLWPVLQLDHKRIHKLTVPSAHANITHSMLLAMFNFCMYIFDETNAVMTNRHECSKWYRKIDPK